MVFNSSLPFRTEACSKYARKCAQNLFLYAICFAGHIVDYMLQVVFYYRHIFTPQIPVTDVVGVTVILLTCSYRSQEFIRVGYYVCNEYTDPELQVIVIILDLGFIL